MAAEIPPPNPQNAVLTNEQAGFLAATFKALSNETRIKLEFSGPKRMTVPVQIESQFRTKANGDSGANRIADKMVPTI